MIFDTAYMITAFVTLLVVVDPIAIAPIFIAITPNLTSIQRERIARRAVLVGGLILVVFALAGEAVLDFIGISMAAFRVAGGVLLFLTALDMLFERRTKRREDSSSEPDPAHEDPSVFPLAIPLIAGPGAIASVILLVGEKPGGEGLVTVFGILAVVLLMMYLMLRVSSNLEKRVGKVAINVFTRIFGMLLAALSVQFVLDGLAEFGFVTPVG
ncbi:MarC family protein [Sulfitobacter sp. F26169L]|uniref:MarC family protein n=1 Tax=Sulfitobacter sp. F26169L TaxID=2996015 RepID=UPI002260BA97|nr:MarC family protein [Sulfitobacter sp. F26169L]MCX7566055.1 MarC family protein [Sulfitobacter sp. F26169L]